MKKFLFIVIMLTSLVSCSNDDIEENQDNYLDELVGTWESVQVTQDEAKANNTVWKYQLTVSNGTVKSAGSDSAYKVGDSVHYGTYTKFYGSYTNNIFSNYILVFQYKHDDIIWATIGDILSTGDKYSFKYIDHNNIMFDDKSFVRIK